MALVVSMANDGQDMHPFFMPKANAGHLTKRHFDVHYKLRKRQETKSPCPEAAILERPETNGCVEELDAAAPRSPLESNVSYRSTTDESKSSTGRTTRVQIRKGSSGSNSSRGGRSQISLSISSSHPTAIGIPSARENSQPVGSDLGDSIARTPPKKMMKVRSDGKLGSPKAISKRGRKPAKIGTVPKTLVVMIKYGTDSQSRSSLGRKITDIFSATVKIPGPAMSKLSKPPEPPKPTHPFFLGASKRDHYYQEAAPSNENKKIGTGDHHITLAQGSVNPIKARVTSRPPSIPERSAGLFGSGGNIFGSDHARISRFPGAMEPLWPPVGMVHVGQDHSFAETSLLVPRVLCASKTRRKMKEAEVRIPKEEQILTRYVDVVHAYRSDHELARRVHSREWREFRRPLRRILTGRELQQAVRREIASKLPVPHHDATESQDSDRSGTPQIPQSSSHPAVYNVYKEIATSLCAFDKFECETQDWVHKYAPASADRVLQSGREVLILRDWLKNLTTNSIVFRADDTSKNRESSIFSRRAPTRKKRRRTEELNGFVLSSDDEGNEMCQITDYEDCHPTSSMLKRSVVRSRDAGNTCNDERVPNTVVISGPHGCGKTAAVYAVARELGFEVFEINAGSRRSGKDILDKVGDMSQNHLVKHASSDQSTDANDEAENLRLLSDKMKQDLDSGRQGTMKSFFKSRGVPKKSPSKRKPKTQKLSPKREPPRKQQNQKQSLILLEEVDILFDDDKAFWVTTLELLVQSKRPIIMTCTDESLLPLGNMILYAILRFTHAPEQLATDYLSLVACNEGHLLPRDAVMSLYKSKGFDLRASMTELNFFCQMSVGDTKGGLEWMLPKSPSESSKDQSREPLRVVSEGTYQTGMGWLSSQYQSSLAEWSVDQESEMLLEAWYEWGLDVGACEAYISPSTTQDDISRTLDLQRLRTLDNVAESLSAADIVSGCRPLFTDIASLDATQPELTEKARSNYIEGLSLLQADPVVDQTGVTEVMAFTIKAWARRLLQPREMDIIDSAFSYENIYSIITKTTQARRSERPNIRLEYAAVFESIARSNKAVLGIPKGPQISTFDGSLSIITEDLAPYVRSIVSYDLRLEEQRGLLSSLLAQPGPNSKRQRTTRASRAALEGGSKAHTRREKWFSNDMNYDSVLQSGGSDWQDIALGQAKVTLFDEGTELDEGSRRDSIGSVMESDH